MFWVAGVAVAAAIAVLGGGVLARSWVDALAGVAPARSSGIWWSLRSVGAGRSSTVAHVAV